MKKKRALFIRMDKIGDLVLTLPCDQRVADEFESYWVIPKGLDFVAAAAVPERKFSTLGKNFSWRSLWNFLKIIRSVKPHVSISYHVPWWINFCLWLGRVPTRGGVLSQWHSYLFLNKGLRQKRSRCEYHEMEYNYILTEHTFSRKRNRELWQPLAMNANSAHKDLHFDLRPPYIVIHPGMGGSALNWPHKNYLELINECSQKIQVVITGTKSDDTYLSPLKKELESNHQVLWLDNQLSGSQLLNVLAKANAIIAPSTGVLHLGTSLGAPSYGIYSPIQVHSAKRWGPQGTKTKIWTPAVQCPSQFECLGKSCPQYDCMGSISAKSVLSALSL